MGTDKHKTPWIQNPKKIQEQGGWVVKRDFITHSGSSEHSLDSESKFEPSVAIDIIGGDRHKSWGQTL